MIDGCLFPDYELRGRMYEIWTNGACPSNRVLVDPETHEDIDTDTAFDPPLTNDELLAIYDYGKGY